jgi:hypothetical protein
VKTNAKHNRWQPVRRFVQILLMCVLPFAACSHLAAKRVNADAPLHVLVFNYSGASSTTVVAAERETSRIFSDTGIDIAWVHCPIPLSADSDEACAADLGVAGEVRVRILDHATENAVGGSVFGFAVAPVFATVYYGDVLRIPSLHNPDYEIPLILGCLIAHEIGHLILGPGAHASSGIMQARWEPADLNRAIRGQIGFTIAEKKVLRANTLTRHRLFISNEQRSHQLAELR